MKYMMLIAGSESEGGVDEERSTAAFGRLRRVGSAPKDRCSERRGG